MYQYKLAGFIIIAGSEFDYTALWLFSNESRYAMGVRLGRGGVL